MNHYMQLSMLSSREFVTNLASSLETLFENEAFIKAFIWLVGELLPSQRIIEPMVYSAH